MTSPAVITLREYLEDPDILTPPRVIAPRIVWERRVTLLAAREKGGKSTLAGAIASAISCGTPFLGEDTAADNVLILALEEHPQEFVQRLVRFGANPDRIGFVPVSGENLMASFYAAAEAWKPSLIIVDTLAAFANRISNAPLEPNDSQGWTRVMEELNALARLHGAMLILHHANKTDGKYRDSTAIGANVDVIVEMFGEGEEPRTLKARGRFFIPETRIKLERDTYHIIETQAEFDERVVAFVAKHPRCTARDLKEGISGGTNDIFKSRDRLLKSGKIVNVGTSVNHAYTASL